MIDFLLTRNGVGVKASLAAVHMTFCAVFRVLSSSFIVCGEVAPTYGGGKEGRERRCSLVPTCSPHALTIPNLPVMYEVNYNGCV